MTFWEAVLLAIVEGLTEFLPVSSTGHMVLVSAALRMAEDPYVKFFEVGVQVGAILSVVVLYFRRFVARRALSFYLTLLVGVLPALILGKLLASRVDEWLESPFTVAVMLFIGGIVFLFVDRLFPERDPRCGHRAPGLWQAFLIGLWQCLALVPGVSRSAASIIGGLQQGLSRRAAAEFSFFLAVPTLAAAALYKGYELAHSFPHLFRSERLWALFLTGNLVAFLVAMAAIRFFVGYLQRHGFRLFGWYRIVLGGLILILHFSGWVPLQ